MSLKGKFIEWAIRAYTDEKYKTRRAILNPIIKSKLEDYMDGKSKWKSKTVWTAIVAVVLSGIQPVSTALGHPIVIPSWIYEVLGGFGLYALRDGQGKPIS